MRNSLDKYYNGKKRNLQAKIKGYNDTFDIDLIDCKLIPDCCIGHFGYNFYFRTNKGLKKQKYKNIKTLYNAIKKTAQKNSLVLESIGLKKDYKYKAIIRG